MAKNKNPFDLGRAETEKYEPNPEVKEEFEYASRLSGGADQLDEKLSEHNSKSPILSGGDIDASWEDADVGEESVGGDNPTPDQDVVEELGEAVGLTYQDNEPLGGEQKLKRRDEERWELNSASAEDEI